MLKTLHIQRSNRGYEIFSETHSTCPTEGYQESHNEGLKAHLALAHWRDLN